MDVSGITSYAWLTAAVATVGVLWGHVRSVFDRLRSFVVVSCTLEGYASHALFLYCRTHLKSSRFDKRHYDASNMYVRPLKRYCHVGREEFGQMLTFFRGWRPLFVGYKRDSQKGDEMTVSCLRGTFDIESLLVQGMTMMDSMNSDLANTKRYTITRHFGKCGDAKEYAHDLSPGDDITPRNCQALGYRMLGWSYEDLGIPTSKEPFEALVYPAKVFDFTNDIKHWLDSEDWYREKGIPWRLGVALKGPPGTGKTSYVRAVAQRFDLPIEIFDLPSMNNEELVRNWGNVLNRTPCIVLFEDIDRIFEGSNIKGGTINKPTVTLDCLLNCISGVETANGVFVVITANDTSKLDPAFGIPVGDNDEKSTRPGRVDRSLYFGPLDEDCRQRLAAHILKEYPEHIDRVVEEGVGETGAQFQKRCGDIAKKLYWEEYNRKRSSTEQLLSTRYSERSSYTGEPVALAADSQIH